MTQPSTPAPSPRRHSAVDISSRAFWSRSFAEREESFAVLRREPELTWHRPLDAAFPHDEAGFWAATRLEDITHVSRRPEVFSSTSGVGLGPLPTQVQAMTAFFLMMDPPEHTTYRRLISAAFTPRQVARIQSQIEASAEEIVDDLVGAGQVDFVQACSSILPMRTVSDMIGIAPGDREAVAHAAEAMFAGPSAAELAAGTDPMAFMLAQIDLLRTAAMEIARHRRQHPADDLMTNIVQAEIDGQRLTDEQIGAFMILLSTAGNDTTKQTTSHTVLALSRHPDQRRWLMADWDGRITRAVEEFVRWATPVMDFSRTAAVDTEIRGTTIRAGEKVGLFYCSGNRDESVFDRPHEFDLTRTPNPHVGFGGGGIHYCLGHSVAKTQLRSLVAQLLTRIPDIEIGEPEYMANSFVHGIARLPASIP